MAPPNATPGCDTRVLGDGVASNPCENRLSGIEWVEFIGLCGALAQLARAPALQAGGPGFESPTLHHMG